MVNSSLLLLSRCGRSMNTRWSTCSIPVAGVILGRRSGQRRRARAWSSAGGQRGLSSLDGAEGALDFSDPTSSKGFTSDTRPKSNGWPMFHRSRERYKFARALYTVVISERVTPELTQQTLQNTSFNVLILVLLSAQFHTVSSDHVSLYF